MMRQHRGGDGTSEPILSVRNLVIEFHTSDGVLRAVDDVSFDVYPGETLGVVGESGSGKSVSVLSILGLIPKSAGRVVSGQVLFEGRDLLTLSNREMRRVRGGRIGMVFQDPMTSLNPVLRVGYQIAEALRTHRPDLSADEARARGVELLATVRVPDPDRRYDQFPHQYSGGMRQRAMIAVAIANQPKILIADEPTTALDVTIQAQVLDALQLAREDTDASMILITHDLGVIAELADHVNVMYGGRIVETGDVATLFAAPRHPYTLGLLGSLPRLEADVERLTPIRGQPPSLGHLPSGCAFHPRCELRRGRERCVTERPPLQATSTGAWSACHFHEEMPAEIRRIAEIRGSAVGEVSR